MKMTLRHLVSVAALYIGLSGTALIGQYHYPSPIEIDPAEIAAGTNSEVGSQIGQFFANNPQYRLSYNILWTANGEASLDQGVHSITQRSEITVGFTTVFAHQRSHDFSFSVQLLRNDNGDYYVRVNWTITDPNASTPATVASGVTSVHRVQRSAPGSKVLPTVTTPSTGVVAFSLSAGPGQYASGSWQVVELPAQRGYLAPDGSYVVEAYTIRIRIFIPDQENPHEH